MPLRYSFHHIRRTTIAAIALTVVALSGTYYAYAYPFGINHTTRKDAGIDGEGMGCWCHNTQSSPNTVVTIDGPQSFEPNTTYTLRLTVQNASERFAGFDIAAKYGTLAVTESGTQLLDGELTHTSPRSLTDGSATWTFKYTTPTDVAFDTIYAGGNAVNGNGTNDAGDEWNWAPNFVVSIGTAGVSGNRPIAAHLKLWPNPSTDRINIEPVAGGRFEYRVLTVEGKAILSGTADTRATMETATLATGSYTIEILQEGKVTGTERFVVK